MILPGTKPQGAGFAKQTTVICYGQARSAMFMLGVGRMNGELHPKKRFCRAGVLQYEDPVCLRDGIYGDSQYVPTLAMA